jgi:iron complex transport system ATP-binding protein
MLHIKNLSTSIGKKTLLQNINLDVKSGDLNIILGPNGAGKSTLLKSIAHILDFNGEIHLQNKNISTYSIEKRSQKIAYMGQFQTGTALSVIDILELSRRKYSGMLLTQKDHQLINTHIKEFYLQKFLHRNIDTLSGGEKQKVFLAASLIQKPKILLLDEPISHLDPKNQIEILEIIKEKTKQHNLITFVVLHDLQNSLHYGDNIIMLKNKTILEFQPSSSIDTTMIDTLYGVNCELFWQNGHPFTFLKHTHIQHHNKIHSHQEQP